MPQMSISSASCDSDIPFLSGYAENSTLDSPDNENQNLRLVSDRCHEFDGLEFDFSALQETRERKLAPETEFERQMQRPPRMVPNDHQIHEDLYSSVSTGELQHLSSADKPAFRSFSRTTIFLSFKSGRYANRALCNHRLFQDCLAKDRAEILGKFFNRLTGLDSFQRPV